MSFIKIGVGNRILKAKDCRSLLHGMKGLMFSEDSVALVRGNSIWMPFVKSPLHLYFLDKNFVVTTVQYAVPLALNPRTWRFYSDSRAEYCLESAERLILRENMKIKILP